MMILFLDDMEVRHDAFKRRNPEHNIHHVYTAEDAIFCLKYKAKYDLVSLDHDLNDAHYIEEASDKQEETGYDVATYISKMEQDKLPTQVIIHSWNPVGAERMKLQLHGLGMFVACRPF